MSSAPPGWSRAWLLAAALCLIAFAPAYLFVYQTSEAVRFDIGKSDRFYFRDESEVSPPMEMSGPIRYEDDTVEMIDFLGRVTKRHVAVGIPYHARRSPLRLRVRCHRFGLQGSVRLTVNGELLDDFVFTERSYPWGGIRAVIPQDVAERGPLEIELTTEGGVTPPSHLPPDVGVGLDWLEVEPMSKGVRLLPVPREWFFSYLFLGLALAFLGGVGTRPRPTLIALLLVGSLLLLATAAYRAGTPIVLSRLWVAFPALFVIRHALLRLPGERRRRLFPVAALAGSLLVSLAVAEIVARRMEATQQEELQGRGDTLPVLVPNPAGTGSYRLKPNLKLTVPVGRYLVPIETNSHGMRWREVPVKAPPGIRRVAFFGDSFTFGSWSDSVEKSFVGVFESQVASDGWEALNFGVGGYGLADIELLLLEKGLDFSPDYVVLVLFNGNDFRDTYLGARKDVLVDGTAVLDLQNLERRVPEQYVRPDRTNSSPAYEGSFAKRALRRLALFRLAAPLLRMENLAIDFAVNNRFVSYSFWSRFPYPEVALDAKDASLAAVARIQRLVSERGARLALVTLPTREQVYATEMAGDHYDLHYPQAYVRTFARENAIPFLDVLPQLRSHVERTNANLYVRGDTHFNNEGHFLVGREIVAWFRCCVAD